MVVQNKSFFLILCLFPSNWDALEVIRVHTTSHRISKDSNGWEAINVQSKSVTFVNFINKHIMLRTGECAFAWSSVNFVLAYTIL